MGHLNKPPPKEIKNGMVQGAVLSVTLFLIAIADIVKEIFKETCTILGYTDDWVLVISSKVPIRAETRLKEAANSFTRWASDNGFKISTVGLRLSGLNNVIYAQNGKFHRCISYTN
jgi:hypothetical protein